MTPQWPDLVLTTDIPDGEGDVLVLHRLDVEPDGGDRRDDLAQLELVDYRASDGGRLCESTASRRAEGRTNRGFTGGIQTDHQNSHLALSKEALQQLRD